jgi:hypothetical protein
MQTNQTTIERYSRLVHALNTVTQIECEQQAELDGRTGRSRVTLASYYSIAETVMDVLIRNVFPRVSIEQHNALIELMTLRELMEKVPAEGILTRPQQDIQNGFECAKARVRHLLPPDEQSPIQQHYLETVLLK